MFRSLVYLRAVLLISTEIYFGFWDCSYLIQIVLCYKISPRLILVKQESGEPRSTDYLLQRLSVAVQRGNAASVRGGMSP